MATKLKIVDHTATDVAPPPAIPEFTPAPTRKRHAGWTAERQRIFIERLSLTGNVGEACALAGMSSTSFYRLCNTVGADSFVKAFHAARMLASTRGSAIAWDRAVNGRVERFYKNGDPLVKARTELPQLLAGFTDVSPEECECDETEYIDERLGEMADGKVAPED